MYSRKDCYRWRSSGVEELDDGLKLVIANSSFLDVIHDVII